MKYTIGLRDSKDIQRYAAEMLRRAPRMHKGDLVARAIYTYLGGKDMTEEELAILLTGQPPTTGKKAVRRTMPKAMKPTVVETPRTEKPDQPLPETVPNTVPKEERPSEQDYDIGADDASMVNDVMAEFAAL